MTFTFPSSNAPRFAGAFCVWHLKRRRGGWCWLAGWLALICRYTNLHRCEKDDCWLDASDSGWYLIVKQQQHSKSSFLNDTRHHHPPPPPFRVYVSSFASTAAARRGTASWMAVCWWRRRWRSGSNGRTGWRPTNGRNSLPTDLYVNYLYGEEDYMYEAR